MTTTHLNQHLIGAVCTCLLYLHPLPLRTVYNYTVICGYHVPAQTCQLYGIDDCDWFGMQYCHTVSLL